MRSNQEIASDIVKRHRFDEGEENTVEVDRSGLIGDIAEALTTAGTPEAQRNRYDRRDRVKQEAMMRAAGLKIAAYRVRDPETDEWSPIQFHMTHDNTVMGMLSEASAKLFATFVRQTLGEEPIGWRNEHCNGAPATEECGPFPAGGTASMRNSAAVMNRVHCVEEGDGKKISNPDFPPSYPRGGAA
jgi:hypothetical protein